MLKPTRQKCLVAKILGLSLLIAGTPADALGKPHVIPSLEKNAIPRRHPLRVVSPDGLYVAVFSEDVGESADVSIYERKHADHLGRRILGRVLDVSQMQWAPRHHHLLVLACFGEFGTAKLAMWSGGKHLVILVHPKDPQGDDFDIDGITADGRTLLYRHVPWGAPDREYRRVRTRRLPAES